MLLPLLAIAALLAIAGDYPLFGEHRERRVVRMHPDEVNAATMALEHVDGVLFANTSPPPPTLVAHAIGTEYFLVIATEQLSASAGARP